MRKWKFSPFFSAKGVVKFGVKFWWNFPCYVFQGLGVRRKISPKFHVKNGVKNGKFHANFTLLGRSAEENPKFTKDCPPLPNPLKPWKKQGKHPNNQGNSLLIKNLKFTKEIQTIKERKDRVRNSQQLAGCPGSMRIIFSFSLCVCVCGGLDPWDPEMQCSVTPKMGVAKGLPQERLRRRKRWKTNGEKMVDFWCRLFSRFGADFFHGLVPIFSRFIRDANGEKKHLVIDDLFHG